MTPTLEYTAEDIALMRQFRELKFTCRTCGRANALSRWQHEKGYMCGECQAAYSRLLEHQRLTQL